ncbi:flagellar basal body rod protein FlgB [Ilumatobacter sp.]|uniref:flagellar basal body rod protein FlgB n=1 Tax=Ilumatobacter sp. TaxID=1967498 RepID=UPI003B5214CF
MSIIGISDTATSTLHRALDGLDVRQQTIASNLANLETPGYQARRVSFEDSLRSAASDGDLTRASVSVDPSLAPTRLNGNNVDIDFELLEGSETALRQQLITQGLSAKYAMLRTAINGR